MKQIKYRIVNNRGQQYGPDFDTWKKASNWLEKKISAPVARTQFYLEPFDSGDSGKESED